MKNLLFIVASALGACKTIETKVQIKAPRELVWDVLLDTKNYKEWNSFMKIEGSLKKGSSLSIEVHPVGDKAISFSPSVLEADDFKIKWRGHFIIPGLATGTHSFRLIEEENETVLFHNESFSGVFIPFVGLKGTKLGFEKMNEELKKRAEGLAKKEA